MLPQAHEGLAGVRVALLEARMAGEMADLVRRHGGIVISAPAVSEVATDRRRAVADFLDCLSPLSGRIYVFLTGAGATALLDEARQQGRSPMLLESLRQSTVVCRGPKPAAALRRHGIAATVTVPSPYTSRELLDVLAGTDLAGTEVTVIHYGERNDALSATLRSRGALVNDLCVYEWRLPADIQPLRGMVSAIVHRDVDVVVFTSQVQWKHLLQVASKAQLAEPMVDALRSDVVVAAIGPVCEAALVASGVRPHVVPANPKMGPLIAELAHYFGGSSERCYVQTGGG